MGSSWNILEIIVQFENFFCDNQVTLLFWSMFTCKFLWCIEFLNINNNSLAALVTSIKFLILISWLIFIRGGIPRYRYDFLTKIGWIKFLSLMIFVFVTLVLLTVVWY